ncbi:hypothetical protein C8Q75DRAFT_747011 [Abortiporus biennis]|nr:hypothetical protein C8Q75DRAFT_747011 [Abortiporus biennis]
MPQSKSTITTHPEQDDSMILNYDILLVIMSHIHDQLALFHYMITCKTLYHAGFLYFLELPLYFSNTKDVRSDRPDRKPLNPSWFLSFMARNPSQYLRIKDLDVAMAFGHNDTGAIEDILKTSISESKQIERLRIYIEWRKGPDIRFFIPESYSFQCLQHLDIRYLGEEAMKKVATMDAPLKTISIGFARAWDEDGEDSDYSTEPIPLLKNFAETLEELHVEDGQWITLDEYYPIIYSRLHTLKLSAADYIEGIPLLGQMNYSFPNLTTLHIESMSPPQEEMDFSRSCNLLFLRRHRERGFQEWPHLKYLETEAATLYCLALSCNIEQVKVTRCSSRHMIECEQALASIRPQTLDITFNNPHEIFAQNLDRNPSLIFAYVGLNQLTVTLNSTRITETVHAVKQCLEGVIRALSESKAVKKFSLTVKWGELGIPALRNHSFNISDDEDSNKDYHPQPNPTLVYGVCPDHISEYFNSLDHADLAKRFVDFSPSLESIELNFVRTSPEAHVSRKWNVVREDPRMDYTLEAM